MEQTAAPDKPPGVRNAQAWQETTPPVPHFLKLELRLSQDRPCMRAVLILATLLCTATFSAAQTQPDRSGPSSREQRYQMFQDYLMRRAREVTRNNLAGVKS